MENLKLGTKFNLNPSPIIHFIVNTFVFGQLTWRRNKKHFKFSASFPSFRYFPRARSQASRSPLFTRLRSLLWLIMSKVLVDLDNTKTVNLHKNCTTQSRCQFKEGVPSVQFLFSTGNNTNSEPAQVHTLYWRDRAGDGSPPPLFRMAIFLLLWLPRSVTYHTNKV